MIPEGIQIGNYMLRFYGLLIVLGAIAATWLASRQIRRKAADTIEVKPAPKAVSAETGRVDIVGIAEVAPTADESTQDETVIEESPKVETEADGAEDELTDEEDDEGDEEDEEEDEEDDADANDPLEKEANRLSEMAWDIMPWALLGGVLGARLWHILLPPASMVEQGITTMYYLTHPLNALAIWNGGLGIPGAVIGGFIAVWIYCRNKGIPVGFWADAIAPGLALAQAVGRWGNFFNQELYGAPTDLPWKLFISPQFRLAKYTNISYYHPLFLYESLWNLANMGLLLWLSRRYQAKLKTWDVFFVYMIFYGFGRFMLEFLRLDPAPLGTFNANQSFMAVAVVAGAVGLILNHRKPTIL